MLDKIYATEMKYYKTLCQSKTYDAYTRFEDLNIKDMYSHNFVFISSTISEEEFIKVVEDEITVRLKAGYKYFRLVTSHDVSKEWLNKIKYKYDLEMYDYYGSYTNNSSIKHNKALVKKAVSDLDYDHGRCLDIAANYRHMTLEFAIRRIDRKIQVYKDSNNDLDLYICYDDLEPVGNVELLTDGKMAKIEDFDILDIYQKKGYGSTTLSFLLKECQGKGIEYAYLVTDHDDTAKSMYEKCGFTVVGNRTEIMFHL